MCFTVFLIPHSKKTKEELTVKQIYLKQNGEKVTVEVSDEVEKVLTETRRGIWRNDAKENYYKYKKPLCKPLEDLIADPQPDMLDMLIEAEDISDEHEKLRAGVDSLSKEQREILRLRFFENKHIKEIASIYGITYQAVQNRLNKVIKKLKSFF